MNPEDSFFQQPAFQCLAEITCGDAEKDSVSSKAVGKALFELGYHPALFQKGLELLCGAEPILSILNDCSDSEGKLTALDVFFQKVVLPLSQYLETQPQLLNTEILLGFDAQGQARFRLPGSRPFEETFSS